MIPVGNVLTFALAALGLMIIPGPSMLFVIGRSLALGRIGGLVSVAGNAAGALVIAAAVALGVGVIVEQSVVLFTAIKIVGALYLVFLGVQAIRHRNDVHTESGRSRRPLGTGRMLAEGFVVGVSNPKTIVFLVAVLPQFVDYPRGGIPLQLAILGAVFVAIALVSDSVWALVAGAAREWFVRSPHRIGRLGAVGGVIMIVLGAAVLFVGSDSA
ncbi:LysE family translocator [Frigoribacterium sp. CG_9.8]|uniref:LysE family translocator n=1 Tax=Frigoribacterium sp. CG_9.8 TaxID=2787733 RepID=UPI0018C8F25B|nr:LysE family translocator [Frigoribacterium sp. CG_9.8]MBG6107573.1 threonine/homoserine/homoserine lactone efflux protein [Frigoribacterium sp. CG_9.8]